ncbi:hypothetical protein LJU32_24995 [Pseudomonas sp. B21_DOA]|nr:hypothetical protein LJU32_24995 [Pseudomonas sp. B21_DOA]
MSMNGLRRLDLGDNPLGTFPDLNLLPELRYIDLSNSGLTVLPDGLATHPKLPIAVLTGNRITDLPDALFEIPGLAATAFIFPTTRSRPRHATRSKPITASIRTILMCAPMIRTLPLPDNCLPGWISNRPAI